MHLHTNNEFTIFATRCQPLRFQRHLPLGVTSDICSKFELNLKLWEDWVLSSPNWCVSHIFEYRSKIPLIWYPYCRGRNPTHFWRRLRIFFSTKYGFCSFPSEKTAHRANSRLNCVRHINRLSRKLGWRLFTIRHQEYRAIRQTARQAIRTDRWLPRSFSYKLVKTKILSFHIKKDVKRKIGRSMGILKRKIATLP